jgi:hypothetical protein
MAHLNYHRLEYPKPGLSIENNSMKWKNKKEKQK